MPSPITQSPHPHAQAAARGAIRLAGACRSFGPVRAVDGVDVDIAAGSCTALLGPSGCGKTTLLRMMASLETADRGTVARGEGPVGLCFQEPRLLPWRTVVENVALPLELAGVARADRLKRAREAIRLVRLDDAAERFPRELSGGMRMRASLARALVTRPTYLFLDEPFGALDEVTRHELDEELRTLWERERLTVVLVTHSVPEAVYLAERVLVFSPRPARIVADIRTPSVARDAAAWTGDEITACARVASTALLAGIRASRADAGRDAPHDSDRDSDRGSPSEARTGGSDRMNGVMNGDMNDDARDRRPA
jgi:NitT/TauT family transport system ATP-binding protein